MAGDKERERAYKRALKTFLPAAEALDNLYWTAPEQERRRLDDDSRRLMANDLRIMHDLIARRLKAMSKDER